MTFEQFSATMVSSLNITLGLCTWIMVSSTINPIHKLSWQENYFIDDPKVAFDCIKPHGRVLGVDIIPAQPPKGVSTIQGNFLSEEIQADVRSFLRDPQRGRPRRSGLFTHDDETAESVTEEELEERQRGYIDRERRADLQTSSEPGAGQDQTNEAQRLEAEERTVDVVLSDMSEPWEQTTGFWKRSLSNPYHRMMNTSGMAFRDHAGSMV